MCSWTDVKGAVRQTFPGPRDADVPFRVAFDRRPHAEFIGHAKESLDTEVCGVLVGDLCKDDEGLFAHVREIIRGEAAREGGGHVTFTHETWEQIHKRLETDFPQMQIVGWYHSHPGFGVEFSKMDLFIQENFFAAPGQLALVMDPLSGKEAMCVSGPDGLVRISRFWIEGREQRCELPTEEAKHKTPNGSVSSNDSDKALEALQRKLNQLIQTLDEQYAGIYRLVLSLGMIIAVAVIAWIGFGIYRSIFAPQEEPPRLRQYVPVAIQVGDETVMVGVGIVDWKVPPELDPALELKELKARMDKKKASTQKQDGTTPREQREAPSQEGPRESNGETTTDQ
ncbi:MAG: Mov34/MPN/PAD-1 family protein [Verrucomicrobia bacterium]|nr:Mov34/MPN/PAD-1 family protein [Verrucomicrobiota bacterium]